MTHEWKTIGVPPPTKQFLHLTQGGHWVTNIFDFIKSNNQNHIKMLGKLHNIFVKLCTLFVVLSFNSTLVFRLFAKGKTFVYMSPYSQKFDTSHTSSIYFSSIDKNYYVMPGGKWMVRGNRHMLRKQFTCDVLRQWANWHTHEFENYNLDSKYSAQNVNKSLKLSQCPHC